jgi:hypothetical protein
MSIESVARHTPWVQVHARSGNPQTLADRRLLTGIWCSVGRHHRRLAAFVGTRCGSALLTVPTPVLVGKVVNATVRGATSAIVVLLAGVIVAVAMAEPAVSPTQRLAWGVVRHAFR